MNLSDYIIKDFSPLSLKSTVHGASELCNNFSISHVPVVENNKLLGCFSHNDIETIENKEETLENFSEVFDHFSTDGKTSLIELIKLFASVEATIIPVVKNNNYVGYYELTAILDAFASSPFLSEDGFTLILEKKKDEYSMSEIAQITESNKGILLGCFISNKKSTTIELTLKIATQDINEIIQSFRRYNYQIISEHEDDYYLEELKNRSDYLQKFLNT